MPTGNLNTPLLSTLQAIAQQRNKSMATTGAAIRALQQSQISSNGSPGLSPRISPGGPLGFNLGKVGNANTRKLIGYAEKFIGTPYQWGGESPSGFDCSGFVQYVYSHFGVKLPRVSKDQAAYGTPISREQAKAGDLVYYGRGSGVHHIGIYLGGGKFLEAPHTGDYVKIAPIGSDIGGFTRVIH